MAKLVFVGTHGPEDSSRASFPFVQAAAAAGGGHPTSIVLVGEAVLLMKDAIAENVHGHGLSPFKDLLRKVIDAKIPVYM